MTNDKMPVFAFGSRVRPSPYFEATLRWGASAFTTYNHTCMPARYGDGRQEYVALTTAATLWDVAAERQVEISGADAFAFAQYLTPRDLSSCAPGKCRYVLITNAEGGVINDPVLLRLEENLIWLSAADSDLMLWCRGIAAGGGFDVVLREPDVSPLQLQGPKAADVAAAMFGEWVRELAYFHLRRFDFEGAPLVVSRTGWSGERGYEIYLCDGERGDWLWERIMSAGKPFGICPAAPSAVRRIEGGLLSYGADINGKDTPMHLGLERLVHLDGDFDFIGKRALRAQKSIGRKLAGVVLDGSPFVAPLARWRNVLDIPGGARVGKVRSAVYSPRLQKNIGIAMLDNPHNDIGAQLYAESIGGDDGRRLRVCQMPFVDNSAAG
ncbi:MAG: glycine cleavage T C-terminal barrel domain-containing protein [Gammaproteobacteria bacterium]